MATDFKNLSYEKLKRLAFVAKEAKKHEVALDAARELKARTNDAKELRSRFEAEGIETEDGSLAGFLKAGANILVAPISNIAAKSTSGLAALPQQALESMGLLEDGGAADTQKIVETTLKDFLPQIDTRTEEEIVAKAADITPEIVKEGVQAIGEGAENVGAFVKEDIGGTLAESGAPGAAALVTSPIIASPQMAEAAALGTGAAVQGAKLFSKPSKTKTRIAGLLEEKVPDVETARFELARGASKSDGGSIPDTGGKSTLPSTNVEFSPFKDSVEILKDSISSGGSRIKRDREAIETIKQGFDEGVVAAVKAASPNDRKKMLKMVNIKEAAKKNKRLEMTTRPSDVAGDTVMERFNFVRQKNKDAIKNLDDVAKDLKGEMVDYSDLVDDFVNDLDDTLGVTINSDLTPNFSGSIVEGVEGAEKIISKMINRMKTNPNSIDAFELHRLKKFIDEQVSYGKTTQGLGGKTENMLKQFRRKIDGRLDTQFPEYDNVNTVLKDTIDAMDSLQDATGKKLDFSGPNADKAVGTPLRRLMGNAQSRVNLLDALNQLDGTARKYGAEFDDDLLTQVLFADELDSVFGTSARTSFRGEVETSAKRGMKGALQGKQGITDILIDKVAEGADKARGINEENAFKSIKTLLNK